MSLSYGRGDDPAMSNQPETPSESGTERVSVSQLRPGDRFRVAEQPWYAHTVAWVAETIGGMCRVHLTGTAGTAGESLGLWRDRVVEKQI